MNKQLPIAEQRARRRTMKAAQKVCPVCGKKRHVVMRRFVAHRRCSAIGEIPYRASNQVAE